MSHIPECRHKTADCNCEALELREDLVLERAVNARLVADVEARISAAVAAERERWATEIRALPCMSLEACADDCPTCSLAARVGGPQNGEPS